MIDHFSINMRNFSVVFLVLCIAAANVYSKSVYRNGRELVASEDALVQQNAKLRQELPGPIPLDGVQPVLVLKEEVLVPVESLQSLEPAADEDVPGTIVVEDDLQKGEYVAIVEEEQNQPEEQQQTEEVEPMMEDGLKGDSVNEPLLEHQMEQENPVGEANNEEQVNSGLKQGVSTTARPSLLEQAQQIISNNPFGQFIDSIRRPSTVAPLGQQAAVETTTNANILQQIQAGVQNIGSQITSALIPPNQNNVQPAESSPTGTVVRPPNFFEQLQTNFQNTVQGIFRPNPEQSATGGAQPQGPLQAVLSNVQNFLTGNRGEAPSAAQVSTSDAPQKGGLPVDDKVEFNKNSGEVQEDNIAASSEVVEAAAQPAQAVEAASEVQKQDEESVVLVAQESSLENES